MHLRHIISVGLFLMSLAGSGGAWADLVDEAALATSSNGISPNLITEYEITRDAAVSPPQVSAARTSSQAFNLGTPSQGTQSKSSGLSGASGQRPDYMARVYQPNSNLHQVQVGDELQFETPQGQTYPTTVTKVSVTERGNTVIHGSAGDVKLFAVVNPGGQFFSSIETPEGKFQSSIDLGETLVFSGAEGGIAETPFVDDMNLPSIIEEQPAGGASPPLAELAASTAVITVGILVDDLINENIDVAAMVDFYIGVANDSYQNSGVDIRFDVVAIGNYEPYLSFSDMSTTLRWITCGSTSCSALSGVNSVVRNWRDEKKADMVAQFVAYGTDSGTCGVGWIPNIPELFTDRNNLMQLTYSVNALVSTPSESACPDIVLAHEMGHNFGLMHDRDTCSGACAPLFDYAYGYKVDGVFGTVMSYVSPNAYLYNLSNPNLNYNGYPIGVPIGQPTQAFAAEAVKNVMSYHANIYDPVSVFHTVTASASVGGSISPSGDVSIEEGQSTTFTVTPQQDYSVQGVTGCSGTLVGNSYTTGAITAACSVSAQFSLIPMAPSAPQITVIEPGDAQVSISVSVADDGGSPITDYTAGCISNFDSIVIIGTSPTSPITVSGLTNGEAYECLVTATNDIGTSLASAASAPVTPVAPPPGC